MCRSMYLLLILFCSWHYAAGQTIQNSTLLDNLLSDSTEISSINPENYKYITIPEWPFSVKPQILVKNKNGLYIFLDGTGRLYKAISDEKGVGFQRIDTTAAFDYNNGSFAFSYNDTIYNIGGYGLWRINGQLRKYIEKTKQWDIVKLNEELPLLYEKEKTLVWYDQHEKKIYTGLSRFRNEAIKTTDLNEAIFIYEVSVLDLVTKEWKKIGKLSPYLREQIPILANITSSPWGQLMFSGNKFMLVDFKYNKLLSLKPAKEEEITSSLAPHESDNAFYFKDSTLFAANSSLSRIDSFSLSQLDFVSTNEIVYEPFTGSIQTAKTSINYKWYLALAFVLIAGYVLWFIGRRKTKKSQGDTIPKSHQSVPQSGNGVHHITFEERELEVLRLIYTNSSAAKITTLEELNKVMGISKRSIGIQKKQRSDVIVAINRKYNYMHPEVKTVLDKKRSDFDKRSFEYFIVYELLEGVSKLLETVSSKKAE